MKNLLLSLPVRRIASAVAVIHTIAVCADEPEMKVRITPELGSFQVRHQDETFTVQRNQNPANRIPDYLSLTSRECPPHCVQPIKLEGVETVGELEVIDYLQRIAGGDRSVLVVDTRSREDVAKGTIPGSISVFGNELISERGANPIRVEEILTGTFGVGGSGDDLDFSTAKTLVLFCYGIWCGQGPKTAYALIDLGYPRNKIKWYRGGIQDWESVGLTTVRE
jgi:rhodanese-related sulfurtransferase